MKNNRFKLIAALVCVVGITSPASVFATNGMFMIGTGAKARSMGGVGITMTHDVFTTAANPATMTEIAGNRFDIGGDIFTAPAEATLGQGANKVTVKSEPTDMAIATGIWMMPAMGATWNKGDLSYGITAVPVGGGGSRYNYNLYNCANSTPKDCNDTLGVSLMVMDINPTVAMKLDENNSVGATVIIGMQLFKAYGLTEFTTFTTTQDDTAKLTNNGHDVAYGMGVRLGWLGSFMQNKLALGAVYTSQTYMTKFDEYSDLFAEQGSLNTPCNIGVGASYKVDDKITVAMDINYIMYEDVAAIGNPGPNLSGNPFPVDRATNALGRDDGLGFGWENQTAFKLGLIY